MQTLLETPCDLSTAKAAAGRACRRILVIDDDNVICQFNAAVLIRAGYDVDVAEDGVAGWDALQSDSYDLLITDNNMPRLTGIDLVKELRSAGITLPIIMATGSLKELAQNAWLESVSTLAKPYTADQLLVTVQKVLPVESEVNEWAFLAKDYCPGATWSAGNGLGL